LGGIVLIEQVLFVGGGVAIAAVFFILIFKVLTKPKATKSDPIKEMQAKNLAMKRKGSGQS